MLRVFRRTNPQGIVLVRGETTPTFFLVAFDPYSEIMSCLLVSPALGI